MKFSSVLAVIAAPLALASPIATLTQRQSADAVQSSIATIASNLVQLNTTVTSLKVNDPAGITKALKVQQQSKTLANAIKAGTTAAQQSPNFDDDQSANVAIAFLDLQPQIQSLLANIVSKKAAFSSAGFFVGDLSKTVYATLQTQRSLTKGFADAVQPKWAAPYGDIAPGVVAEILGYFDAALPVYATCAKGKLCLPVIGS